MKKIIIGIVLLSSIIGVYNVTSKSDSDEVIILKEAINSLYTINNQTEYDEFMEQMADPNVKVPVSVVYTRYEEFCTENGLGSIFGNRLYTDYRKAAQNSQFTMQIKELDFEKTFEKKADGTVLNEYTTVGYEYTVNLEINYGTEQSNEILIEEGNVNLKEIDGNWKVDLLQPIERNDFFKLNQEVLPIESEDLGLRNDFIMNEGINEFLDFLSNSECEFTHIITDARSDYIPGNRMRINLFDEMIIVHQFESEERANDYTMEFDSGGGTIGNHKISWAGNPHFYNRWDLIVEYVGENNEILDLLNDALGEQFSGYN